MPITPVDARPAAPLVCHVMEERASGSTQLWLRLEASADVAGRYTLLVRKSDRHGTGTTQQGGAFSLSVGETKDVGRAVLSIAEDGELAANGYVDLDGQRIDCQAERLDRI